MSLFKICWIINLINTLIVSWFFINGLMNGSVDHRNIKLWLFILVAAIFVLYFSVVLHRSGQHRYAMILSLSLAVPAVICAIVVLYLASGNSRWN